MGSVFEFANTKFCLALLIAFFAFSFRVDEIRSAQFRCLDLSLSQLYADYIIFDVVRYRGGMTDELTANQKIGSVLIVRPEQFRLRNLVISNPLYQLRCYSLPSEGEVAVHRWSNFYGFGLERRTIKVLGIYDENDTSGEPSKRLEILRDQLWEMYDGWLYKMKLVS